MNDLNKYHLVNSCETIEDLKTVILQLSDEKGVIKGKSRDFNAKKMADLAEAFIKDNTGLIPASVITRNWGLRQQALYIKHYI